MIRTKTKTHWRRDPDHHWTACSAKSTEATFSTADKSHVDCKRCLAVIARETTPRTVADK